MSDPDTDVWLICKKCGKAFENWSTIGKRVGRCLKCADAEMRKAHGAPPKSRACELCGLVFLVPNNAGASTKYCLEHRGMTTAERVREFAIRDGLPHTPKRFARKVVVDNNRYVNVNSLLHEPVEKMLKILSNKKVRLVG